MTAPSFLSPEAAGSDTVPVWPQPPLPPVIPPPETIPFAGPRPPIVILPPRWEYKHLIQPVADGGTLRDSELNRLGQEGWDLVGVVTLAGAIHFYFKREII